MRFLFVGSLALQVTLTSLNAIAGTLPLSEASAPTAPVSPALVSAAHPELPSDLVQPQADSLHDVVPNIGTGTRANAATTQTPQTLQTSIQPRLRDGAAALRAKMLEEGSALPAAKSASANDTRNRFANKQVGPNLPTQPDIDPELKQALKTAREWVDNSVPWAGQLKSDGEAQTQVQVVPANYIYASPPIGEPGGSFRDSAQRQPAESHNIFVDASRFVKEVVNNPVTWMLTPLVLLGTAAIWLLRRKPF